MNFLKLAFIASILLAFDTLATVTIDGKVIDADVVITTNTGPVTPPVTPPVDPIPDPKPTPPRQCAKTLTQGFTLPWTSNFVTAFPGPKSRQTVRSVPRNGYLAIKFNTGNVIDSGKLINFEATATPGDRVMSLSKCAGAFAGPSECVVRVGTYAESILWTTSGNGDGRYCQLERNTTYYWNITFTDGRDPGSSECVGRYCFTTLRVWNFDYR